jgi:hypothetical protein
LKFGFFFSLKEFEDETLIERLYGLTEMFPNWLQTLFQNSYQYGKYFGQFIKKTIWFCSSSFIILILPILVQLEFSQVIETQVAQTRQVKSLTQNPKNSFFFSIRFFLDHQHKLVLVKNKFL